MARQAAAEAGVTFDNVTVNFRGRCAVQDVSLSVERSNFTSIIGPSGCGKTTLLNLCAGLLQPSSGEVRYGNAPVTGLNTEVGYVTQDANLLPWLNVASNIGLGLKLRGVDKAEREGRVASWIELMGLKGFEKHFPRELSGGMKKRVAVARALITGPGTLLMDEPFGALDSITRMVLQQELLDLCQSEFVPTVLFVTHDLSEALVLADEVVVMSGRPGTVSARFSVPIERPRKITDLYDTPVIADLSKRLWHILEQS